VREVNPFSICNPIDDIQCTCMMSLSCASGHDR